MRTRPSTRRPAEVRHDDGRLRDGNDGDDVDRRPVEPGAARDAYRAALGGDRAASAKFRVALGGSGDRAPVINWLIDVSLRNRFLVIAFFVLVAGWGYWALRTTPIDAIPDLSDNQVIVFTDWPGRSPQEVEDQITYPLTVSLQGLPGVRVVRSSSAFGFSMINVIFEDSVDLYFARSRVLERLNLLTKALPAGAVPALGPDATGVGHVFWYTVEGQGQSLRELRAIQDWYIRYQLNSVPGVAEVASVGGTVRQYQVDVDPKRLRAFRIPISAVVEAVMRSNRNVGGNVVEGGGAWSVVPGLGLVAGTTDLVPILLRVR